MDVCIQAREVYFSEGLANAAGNMAWQKLEMRQHSVIAFVTYICYNFWQKEGWERRKGKQGVGEVERILLKWEMY